MKKTHLFAATALLSVLTFAGIAQARESATLPYTMKPAATATTEAPATTQAPAPMMMGKMAGMPIMPKLSEAGQKLMKDSMEKMHEENKGTFDEIMAKHKELQEIVKAPAFDKSAFVAKHEEIDALRQKLDQSRIETLATVMEKMPAADRAQMGGMGMGHGPRNGMMGAKRDCPMMGATEDGEQPAKAAPVRHHTPSTKK